jgi:hypothetical protein
MGRSLTPEGRPSLEEMVEFTIVSQASDQQHRKAYRRPCHRLSLIFSGSHLVPFTTPNYAAGIALSVSGRFRICRNNAAMKNLEQVQKLPERQITDSTKKPVHLGLTTTRPLVSPPSAIHQSDCMCSAWSCNRGAAFIRSRIGQSMPIAKSDVRPQSTNGRC